MKTLSSKNRIQCPLKTGFTVQKKRIAQLSKKDVLTSDEKIKIINDLESRLERLSTLDKVEHWGIEAVVNRLAPYYWSCGTR